MKGGLRQGTSRLRNVYRQIGDEPSKFDPEVARFETKDGAQDFVEIVNAILSGDTSGIPLRSQLDQQMVDWTNRAGR